MVRLLTQAMSVLIVRSWKPGVPPFTGDSFEIFGYNSTLHCVQVIALTSILLL